MLGLLLLAVVAVTGVMAVAVGKMMEELTDDSLDDEMERPLERWAPLGAAANTSPQSEPA